MKKIMAVMLAVLMLVSVTACGSGSNGSSKSGETVVLRVNGQQNDDHQTTKALYRIAEKIEEETNGGLKLDIYTDSVLGDYTTMFEECSMGTVDITLQVLPGNYDQRLEMVYIPYLFTNYEEARQVFSEGSNTYSIYEKVIEEKNMKPMGIFVDDFVQIATVKEEPNMLDPKASKSLLLRVPAIETNRLIVDCQGFPTVTISYSDLYTAMQTGVCDGWLGGTAELNYVGFRDVIKYLYPVNCLMENNVALINQDTWNSLSEEYQEVLYNAFTEEALLSFDRAEANDEENMQKLKEHGVEIVDISDEQLSVIVDHVRDNTWDTVFETLGEDIKKAVYADMGW